MNKARTQKKINNSIKNKNPNKFIKQNTSVNFKSSDFISHLNIYKKNKKTIFDYLEGRTSSLPINLKESAKVYFLFKLKNSKTHLRHKAPNDLKIKETQEKYKSFVRKLSD